MPVPEVSCLLYAVTSFFALAFGLRSLTRQTCSWAARFKIDLRYISLIDESFPPRLFLQSPQNDTLPVPHDAHPCL